MKDWKDIHPEFTDKLQRNWEQQGFTYEETKEWIELGAKLENYEFIKWLRDIKKETPQWILNYKEDYETLSNKFKKYGLCKDCNRPNTGEQWCKDCNSKRLQQDFTEWTSYNSQIDQFIQKYQLEATEVNKFIEWIPYKHFKDIEHIADGEFGKVYKAKWMEGSIHHWDAKNKQWYREKDEEKEKYEKEDIWSGSQQNSKKKYKNYREVVLKSLNNSSTNTNFLQETEKHKIIDDWFNNIVPCYGISQDSKTGDYLMVMQYMPKGNLRDYLSNKNWKLTFWDKIRRLANISQGLKDIHQKNLIHCNFHSGNILNDDTHSFITGFDLCKPVDEINREKEIYGVLPYVAPEVLRGRPYTRASDIYSFGIVAYEILTGSPPYYYIQEHNAQLALDICQGLRPKFNIKIPLLLKDLIERCWDANPNQRPVAQELESTLRVWQEKASSYVNSEFTIEQIQEIAEQAFFELEFAKENNDNYQQQIANLQEEKHDLETKLEKTKIGALNLERELRQLITRLEEELDNKQKEESLSKNNYWEEVSTPWAITPYSVPTPFIEEALTEKEEELKTMPMTPENKDESLFFYLKKIKKNYLKKEAANLKKRIKKERELEKLKKERERFEKQEEEINYLEIRVQELTNLIKNQKQKIINAFLRILPQKELLQELITTYLEFIRFKEQEINSPDYDEKCDEYIEKCQRIKKKLRNKLNKETMNKIQAILTDCENLVRDELELKTKLNNKLFLIENQKRIIPQMVNEEEKKIIELENKLKKHEEINQKQIEYQQKKQPLQAKIKLIEANISLWQEIEDKKSKRNQLLTKLNLTNNSEIAFWLDELIKTQKKTINSPLQNTVLENNQNKLLELAVNQEQINELGELQKEISRLKRELKLEVEKNHAIKVSIEEDSLITRLKRILSISSENLQGKTKSVRLNKENHCSEPMKIEDNNQLSVQTIAMSNWRNVDYDFTLKLIQKWINHHFTPEQCKEWINIGMKIEDYAFCAWLRDEFKIIPEQVLNELTEKEIKTLKQEFINSQQQSQIIQTNLPNFPNK